MYVENSHAQCVRQQLHAIVSLLAALEPQPEYVKVSAHAKGFPAAAI